MITSEPLLGGAERNIDDVISVAKPGGSFGGEDANNGKRHIANTYLLPNGINPQRREQIIRDRLPDNRDRINALLVRRQEEGALLHLPAPNLLARWVDTLHRCSPVLIAKNHLPAGIDYRTDSRDIGYLRRDSIGVALAQCLLGARPLVHARAPRAARSNDEFVGTQAGETLVDGSRTALANRDHQDHRAHTNDNTQRGEQRTHLVGAQCLQCTHTTLIKSRKPFCTLIPPGSHRWLCCG